MRMFLFVALAILGLTIVALALWQHTDRRADRAEMDRLIAMQPAQPALFRAAMVADLPDPARRFFTFAIAEGTPLLTVARLEMEGLFGMGDQANPNYQPMRATQVLAAPHGFVWAMRGGKGAMRMVGSDSAHWTRFWLFSTLPVARMGGSADHTRSAFGRYVAEAVFWTPAALLPGPGITWEPLTETMARVTVRHGELEQSVDIEVAEDGRPLRVTFMRWSDANPEKTYRLQPFGGTLSEFRTVDGFTLPTQVEAGNMFGTDDYFAFFIAEVTDISFPQPAP